MWGVDHRVFLGRTQLEVPVRWPSGCVTWEERFGGRGTTVAVTGKEMVVDAVGMARWPEEG